MFWSKKNEFKLLSISGGNQKGIVSIIMALKLESELKKYNPDKHLIEDFDGITALSSGSLIAWCLIFPSEKNSNKPKYSLNDCLKLFTQGSEYINSKNTTWNKLLLYTGLKDYILSDQDFARIINRLLGADENLYNLKFSEAITPITIISYDIDNTTPRIWSTYEAKNDPKKDFYLRDSVIASTAMPPLFSKKITLSKYGKKFEDYDGGIITPSPLITVIPYISKINNLNIENFFIISIGTTIRDVKETLKDLDDKYILLKATDFISINYQIQKPVLDAFLRYVCKGFYKLDFKVPSEIQQGAYDKNKSKDVDNYNKMIACTLKYIDENEELFAILANKISKQNYNLKKLEKFYEESEFFCEYPEKILVEYNDAVDAIKQDL